MKNLMKKKIATSLGLTLMVASLVVISPDQAQAKVKKKAGNSAKVKSHAKRPGARNGSGSNAKVSTQDVHFSRAKVNSQAIGSGSNAKGDNLSDTMVTGAKANSRAKRGLHLEDISLGVQVPRQTAVSNGSANLQNAENVKSNARRKKVAGAEGFSIDIGTSEKIKSRAERAPATQAGNDTVTVNDRIGIAPKRARRITKHTRH